MAIPLLTDIPLKDSFNFEHCPESGISACTFFAFNTSIEIKFLAKGHLSETLARMAFELCRKYEWLLSHKLEGSELTRLNRAKGDIVEVSEDTWKVIQEGRRYSQLSKGCFDITMGSVTCLWDFARGIQPDADELAAALVPVDYNLISLWKTGEGASTHYFVQLQDAQTKIDLGGVAKGYIADKLAEFLRSQDVSGAFINLGGNVVVFGTKQDETPWTIGLRNPLGKGIVGSFSLKDGSAVTSSDSERVFVAGDERFHHILSLRTGMPVESDLASVTLITRRSIVGDGLSTILLIWGFEKAHAYIEEAVDMEAVFIKKDGSVVLSKGAHLTGVHQSNSDR